MSYSLAYTPLADATLRTLSPREGLAIHRHLLELAANPRLGRSVEFPVRTMVFGRPIARGVQFTATWVFSQREDKIVVTSISISRERREPYAW